MSRWSTLRSDDGPQEMYNRSMGHVALAVSALAAGDVSTAHAASERAWQYINLAQPQVAVAQRAFCSVEVALAEGDFVVARRWAGEAIAMARDGTWWRPFWPELAWPLRNATEKKRSDTPMMGWLAHVYTKLGIKSRVQLVQEASRHA